MTSRWRCQCGNFNNNHAPGCTADYERTQRIADALEPGTRTRPPPSGRRREAAAMNGPRIGELFAGYGGLGMGVMAVLGGDIAWVSEIDRGACKVLAHRYPDAPNHGDVTTIDWASVEPVDILTGGFPCQDLSTAGKRAGMRPGNRSGLWSHFAYAISQLRPPLVVIENVRGLLSAEAHSDVEPCPWCLGDDPSDAMRALGAVLADLADIGYDAIWCGLRAADVGGCHGRFRVFIAAYPAGSGREWWPAQLGGASGHAATAVASDIGHERSRPARDGRARPADGGLLHTPTTRDHKGHNQRRDDTCLTGALLPTPRATDGAKGGPNQRGSSGDLMLPSAVAKLLPTPTTEPQTGNGHARNLGAEARLLPTLRVENNENRQSAGYGGKDGNGLLTGQTSWGDYAAAIARWERVLGRPAPDPTEISPKSMKGCPIHGDSTQTGSAEELPSVRAAAPKEAVFERQARGPGCFPEAESLLPGVREQSPDSHPIGSPEASAESPPGSVPDVRGDGSATRPPRRPQLGQRRPEQPRDPVRLLPPETALAGGSGGAAGGQSVGAGCACKRRLSPEFESWMMGLPAGWITDVPDVTWQEAVRMCGNGVVPQQAEAAVRWLMQWVDAARERAS